MLASRIPNGMNRARYHIGMSVALEVARQYEDGKVGDPVNERRKEISHPWMKGSSVALPLCNIILNQTIPKLSIRRLRCVCR